MKYSVFDWTSDFITGIGIIDDQHYQLVQIINRLVEVGTFDKNINVKKLSHLSKQLLDYVKNTFQMKKL